MRFVSALAALLTLAASPCAAAAVDDDALVSAVEVRATGSTVVSALEVEVRPPGPAMWRVRKGGSEVIILGGLGPLPAELKWDTRRLERALDTADRLYLPPLARVEADSQLERDLQYVRLRANNPGERAIPDEIAARFQRIRATVGTDPDRYATWKPPIAASLMVLDARAVFGLDTELVQMTVEELAEARRLRGRPLARLNLARVIEPIADLRGEANALCVVELLDQIEREQASAAPLSAAWATGDLKTLRRLRPTLPLAGCLSVIGGYDELLETTTRQATRALESALQRPGKAVAVLDLALLLRADGVLDRLAAGGADISSPP